MSDVVTHAIRDLGPAGAIEEASVATYYLDDRKLRISIARVNNHLYAFDDLCTCAPEKCPLSGGQLSDRFIQCQCHGSRFDITSGAVVNGPATEPINIYAVQDVNGNVQIRV